jgi:hypothetical protein
MIYLPLVKYNIYLIRSNVTTRSLPQLLNTDQLTLLYRENERSDTRTEWQPVTEM